MFSCRLASWRKSSFQTYVAVAGIFHLAPSDIMNSHRPSCTQVCGSSSVCSTNWAAAKRGPAYGTTLQILYPRNEDFSVHTATGILPQSHSTVHGQCFWSKWGIHRQVRLHNLLVCRFSFLFFFFSKWNGSFHTCKFYGTVVRLLIAWWRLGQYLFHYLFIFVSFSGNCHGLLQPAGWTARLTKWEES